MSKAKKVMFLVIGILFLIFLLQNTQIVPLRIFFWTISMSRIVLLMVVTLIGLVIGFIIGKKR